MCNRIFTQASLRSFLVMFVILTSNLSLANTSTFDSPKWQFFKPILIQRTTQQSPKMRLDKKEAEAFVVYLNQLSTSTQQLEELQIILPKTTLELLMAVHNRHLPIAEAEKMAAYLSVIERKFKFKYRDAFDENTSHIIGREWHEIDYSGENMTWQKQQLKYQPYGITNFKSLENLKKFFVVESKLPYFKTTYEPLFPSPAI